jgi:arginine utilization protein RocB
LRAKRQSLEEESLKKRLVMHEKNAKELSERLKDAEERAAKEIEEVRARSEERVGELIVEKSELRDRVNGLEKQLFTL